MTHTPFPWKAGDPTETVVRVTGADGTGVAQVRNVGQNAMLVTLVPEMLVALIAAKDALDEGHRNCGGGDDNVFAGPLQRVTDVLEKSGVDTVKLWAST